MRHPRCLVVLVLGSWFGAAPAALPAEPAALPGPSPLLRVLRPGVVPPSYPEFGRPSWNPPAPAGKPDNRTAVAFQLPDGLKVAWRSPNGSFDAGDATPAREATFEQGKRYRLRLTRTLPDKSVETFYPTLEVAPFTPKTAAFLRHCSVPVSFTPDEFAQAKAGELVVKVLYLPDPVSQDFSTVVGAEEVVSTRLEPGCDPVEEAGRRGTILATVRLGNVDLHESRQSERPGPGEDSAPPVHR